MGRTAWIGWSAAALGAVAAFAAPAAHAHQRHHHHGPVVHPHGVVVVQPAPVRQWVPGHWQDARHGHGRVWISGHWAVTQPGPHRPGMHAGLRRFDQDRDGIPNSRDRDIDGDGVPNWRDRAPRRAHWR